MAAGLTCPARMWTKSRTQLWRVVLAPHWTYRHGGAEFLRLSALLRIDLRWSVTCAEAVATSPSLFGPDMTMSVHVTSATVSDEWAHDAQVLRSVLGELRSAEGRSVVEELISGMLADGVVLARVDDVVTPREAGELLGVSRQFVDKLIASGRLAAECKPGSRHRVVRVADVLQLEASRRAGADRIGSTIDTLVDAGAEY